MKRIIAIAASLFLIVSAFSACGKTIPVAPPDTETTNAVITFVGAD